MAEKTRAKTRGNFFAVDARTWAAVCNRGEIADAAAYLVLAQGTGSDHTHTSWSATSLKKYIGMSLTRGQEAIARLKDAGFIQLADTHTKEKPRYKLRPFHEIPQAKPDGRRTKTSQAKPATEQDWIWLPNEFVCGTSKGEDSPLSRLRSTQNLSALRFVVNLYGSNAIAEDGGVSVKALYVIFKREKVGESGRFVIWSFTQGDTLVVPSQPAFAQYPTQYEKGHHPAWPDLHLLQTMGLLSFVPHLWEADPTKHSCEILHAYGMPGAGERIEQQMGTAAHQAGMALMRKFKLDFYSYGACLAPVDKAYPDVQMVATARLRYRPKTRLTADWYGELQRTAPGVIASYEKIVQENPRLDAATA